jgi:hypothetical protein
MQLMCHSFAAILKIGTIGSPIMSADPVFFDESGRRWRIVRWLLIAFLIVIVSLPVGFLISAVTTGRVSAIFEDPRSNTNTTTDRLAQFGRAAARHRLRQ